MKSESAVTTFGGVLVGAALSAVLSSDQTALVRVLATLVTLGGAYLLLAPSVGWRFPGKKLDQQRELAVEARVLSAEITRFSANNDSRSIGRLSSQVRKHVDEDGMSIIWDWENEQDSKRSSAHMSDYQRRFQREAESVYRRALHLGCADEKNEFYFAWPTNSLGIESTATLLGEIADRLEDKLAGK